MLKAMIEKILELGPGTRFVIGGRQYTTKEIVPVRVPVATTLTLGTLTGLADYLKENVDKISLTGHMIQIESFSSVSLLSRVDDDFRDREKLINVKADNPRFPFGQFLDIEAFIIGIQSFFVPTPETEAVLKLVGNITDSAVKQFNDDGVTQQVTAKTGVSRLVDLPVPNPVVLAPYRTFIEIEQPESKFVFRMRAGSYDTDKRPVCALFEADGGSWKIEAVKRIKARLNDNTDGIAIIA